MTNSVPKIDFAVGGQAVMEGVMMRSPNFYTVSVRNPEGKIETQQKKFVSLISRFKILKLPFVRGIVQLVESMIIGYRSLNYSSDVFLGEADEASKAAKNKRGFLLRFFYGFLSVLFVLITLAFTIFLLKVLPLWVAGKAAEFWPVVKNNYLLFNAIDGLTKIVIFISYLLLISIAKDIRRVFQYHGAEHKSIWTYENGLELTVENAREQTRFHPRCGTSFIFIVILMSVFVYTIIPPADTFAMKLVERIAVIPLIAAISYELLKLSAKFQKNVIVKLFVLPGLLIQRITTKNPDDAQLEVALDALKKSLAVEKCGGENVA